MYQILRHHLDAPVSFQGINYNAAIAPKPSNKTVPNDAMKLFDSIKTYCLSAPLEDCVAGAEAVAEDAPLDPGLALLPAAAEVVSGAAVLGIEVTDIEPVVPPRATRELVAGMERLENSAVSVVAMRSSVEAELEP